MKRHFAVAGALLALLVSGPALACSYIHAPEPVGGPSATFIAKRMVDAAAFVDFAVAERAEPMRTPDGRRLGAQEVTFGIVERLKGNSPERFTLFAAGLKPRGTAAEPRPLLHWVDEETGIVFPHSTPWEMPPTEQLMMTSCDPGFIEPVEGRTYLIFREANGALLGPVAFAPGQQPVRGYAFTDAPHPAETEWTRAVKMHSHAAAVDGAMGATRPLPTPYQADLERGSASFARLLTEAEARELLAAAGVRPYAVYTSINDRPVVHRVSDEQASLDAIAGARAEAAATLGRNVEQNPGLIARARAVLESHSLEQLAADQDQLAYARMLIASVERGNETAAAARSDAPFTFGVEFLGGPEAQRRLAASPEVSEVRPGFSVRGRSSVPQPRAAPASERDTTGTDRVAALSPAEIYARLQALVQ